MSTRLSASHHGASWLTEDVEPEGVLTPEKVSSEHRLIAQTATEFVTGEVLPRLDDLERKDWGVARHLMMRCGELGLIGADVPEEYGGVALDKAAAVIVADRLAQPASFGATFGGQANLAVLPLLLVGTEAQKQRYIPRLLTGELIGAYALSESGSGSDALGARARASRQADGSYLLSGEKMWITNGGFADLFIVFAKVDGEHFTAFLVERAFRGVATGEEEHKMGLDGSSTTPLVLSDVVVPPENLLGEIGRGHKVAFNVLNYGRLKLGAMCAGGARQAVTEAARYAADRRQFGRPIASFGAIKHKLGEMTVRTYALESLLFRTAGLLDAWLSSSDDTSPGGARLLAALEEFAVEASIAKVEGSETLDYVLDENVQIHGGNGFVRDYPAERYYRDARVNRIFEGTNEINRLLIPTLVARRAAKGDLELHGPHAQSGEASSELSHLRFVLSRGKDATLRVLRLGLRPLREFARRRAGSAVARRRHDDRRLLGRERFAPGTRGGTAAPRRSRPARDGCTRLRCRRRAATGGSPVVRPLRQSALIRSSTTSSVDSTPRRGPRRSTRWCCGASSRTRRWPAAAIFSHWNGARSSLAPGGAARPRACHGVRPQAARAGA